jgi:putative flippase GtrA
VSARGPRPAALSSLGVATGRDTAVEAAPRGLRGLVSRLLSPASGLTGQGVRFAFTGGLVAAVYLASTTLLAGPVGLPFQAALILGFALSLTVHFTMQRKFVWLHEVEFALAMRAQVLRYLVVAGAQYGITAAATLLLPGPLGLPTEVVYLATALCMVAANFLVFRHGIFHPHRGETP